MVQTVQMPMMGNTMETGLLTEWSADEGDEIEEDDVIAVVESEKAEADIVANQNGILVRVDVEEGEEVPPGTVLGVVLGPDENLDDAPAPRSRTEPGEGSDDGSDESASAETESTTQESPPEKSADEPSNETRAAPGARKLAAEHDLDLATLDGSGPDGAVLREDIEDYLEQTAATTETADSTTAENVRDFSSPSTRQLARELGVSFGEIEGTGISGRITESDVRAAASQTDRTTAASGTGTVSQASAMDDVSGPAASNPTALGVSIAEERQLSGMRQTIAERMARSARQAPHVTLDREVTVEQAFNVAADLTDARDASIGFNDILIAAVVRALESHPEFNAWFEEERLRIVEETNVAIAVDTDAGLVTPVIRETATRSLDDIANERRRLTDAVLNGDYSMDDIQGGTFTISNLGMFGVDSFDPIINPPQIAILGVGRVRDDGDERTCALSLSFDHRVVDGADAARFLDTLTAGIESPTVVVADRASAGTTERDATAQYSETTRSPDADPTSISEAVTRDLEERARDVATDHDWPVPTFEVQLEDGWPSITVEASASASPATMRRLTYAVCRESTYAETITGFRDPDITIV